MYDDKCGRLQYAHAYHVIISAGVVRKKAVDRSGRKQKQMHGYLDK